MAEKIYITGMGAVSPLGQTVEDIWEKVYLGQTPISPLKSIKTDTYKSHLGAEILSFEGDTELSPNVLRRLDKVSKMSVTAALRAIRDAGIENLSKDNERFGVVMGSGFGSTIYTDDFFVGIVKKGPKKANPLLFPNTVPNAAASYISIITKMKGINTTFCHKETSAEQAFSYAFRNLQNKTSDVLLVGGADELSRFLFHSYYVTKTLAPRNKKLPELLAPYDRQRNGLVLGEGAAVLVLEREEHLLKRGGRPYAEVLSSEMSSEPVGFLGYHPEGFEIKSSIEKSFKKASILPSDIDFISGGGNSTELCDAAEAKALIDIFTKNDVFPPIAGLKGYTGSFHGGGALRLVIGLLSMINNYIPITPNLSEPVEGDKLNFVKGKGQDRKIKSFIHLAASYGGTGCSLILKKA